MGETGFRFQVGCAGQFMLGMTRSYDDRDEAMAACESPPGCVVYDRELDEWFGPTCWEELEAAKARLSASQLEAK